MSDSSTGGPLLPLPTPAPREDDVLDRDLQQFVSHVTGLAGTHVRPRWQIEPPNMPAVGTSWAAVGVMNQTGDTFAAVVHDAADGGSDTVFRQEMLDVLVSFYGPSAQNYASLFREGVALAQNREELIYRDMQLISVGTLQRAPSLVNERWQNRVDVPFTLVRAIRRKYAILNLASVEGEIVTDNTTPLSQPINVTE